MPAVSKTKSLLTPTSHYDAFRELLLEALSLDTSFKARYLLDEFESKLLDPSFSDSAELRRERAIEKWLACEDTNRETSMRLIIADETDVVLLEKGVFPVSIVEVLQIARRFIAETIGLHVPWDDLRGSFSGGASTKFRRSPGVIAQKFQEGSNITEAAIMPFLRLTSSVAWAPRDFDLAVGNVMFTVPKSTTIDRAAAKEPEYNMYAQKAIGDFIRSKLKRVGINLNDQTHNQRLAKIGSLEGNLATVDLSSASDSICKQLVLMLLPDDWFHLMDALRSPITMIDDVAHENYMFSSMGNGFTFELESLIFWALTRAVCYATHTKGSVSVYGDDIICPVEIQAELVEVFTFCGFKVNPKKSFFDGKFRESCGKHWFAGLDVTPFYVKAVPVDVSDWCLLLNSFRRWTDLYSSICDPSYFEIWNLFSEIVPAPLWGGGDLASRDTLAAPGRFPIARCLRKTKRHRDDETAYSHGAYLHWLNTTEDRLEPGEVVTSVFTSDVGLSLVKSKTMDKYRDIPLFPQET